MQWDKVTRPELCAAEEDTRYAIRGVAIVRRGEDCWLASTDGHCGVIVRATPQEGDAAEGIYPPEAFAAARRAAPKTRTEASAALNGSARVVGKGGTVTEYPPVPGRFPQILDVFPPKGRKPAHVVVLNAELLYRVQQALGATALRIEFHGDREPMVLHAIREAGEVRDGSLGILMPMSES